MALPNTEKLTSQLSMMTDDALKRMAMMYKQDPYVLPLVISEDGRRKQLRTASAAQAQPQQKVADQDIAQMGSVDPMGNYVGTPLPETVGIGQLPAKNLQRMAVGGIVAFEEGGEVPSFRTGGMDDDVFNTAFLRTLKFEGGRTSDTGGDTKYGISKKGNPDVDIDKLTVEGARNIYKKRYWDAISGDKLAAMNPALAQVAFDTAVNQGVDKAKKYVTESGGDPAKYMQLRGEHYAGLVQKNPEKYGAYAKGWFNRLGNLATDLAIPSARAEEVPGQAVSSAVSQIPTGGKPGAGPTPALPEPEKGFFARQADALGLSEDTKRNISNLNNALAGAMGPAYIPSYLPKTAGLMDLARSGGEKLYGRMFPAAGQLTEAQFKAMQVAKAAEAEKAARFAQEAQMAGALPGEFRAAEQGVGAAQAANAPSKAQLIQEASMAREGADAQRLAQAARLGQYGSQATATTGDGLAPGATKAQTAYDLADDTYNPDVKQGIPNAAQRAADLLNNGAGKEKKSRFTDDDLMTLGLSLMANRTPGTGNKIADLVGAFGQAGLSTLAAKREQQKTDREDLYRQALAREANAKANMYESGSSNTTQALKAANDMYDNWMNSLDKFGKMKLQENPELAQQKQEEFLRKAFGMYKMEMPASVAGGAPAAASQLDPLGILGRKG